MQIETVHYFRLVNLGDYENEKLGATAKVEDGETPENVLCKLREWVHGHLREKTERQSLDDQLADKRHQLAQLTADLVAAEQRWERVATFLREHGVDTRRYEPLPF